MATVSDSFSAENVDGRSLRCRGSRGLRRSRPKNRWARLGAATPMEADSALGADPAADGFDGTGWDN